MPDDNLTSDEIRRMAAEIGLTRLGDEHLEQLLRATRIARARRAALPLADLTAADEPAHVFRLPSSLSLLPEGEGNEMPALSTSLIPCPSPGGEGNLEPPLSPGEGSGVRDRGRE